jgi:hypothetical protein
MANQVVITTFWNVIQENLFRGAEFLNYAVSHDAFVNGNSVELPQAGDVGDVLIDQGDVVLPLPISPREDGKSSYILDNYRIPPTLIEDSEALELSYDKASSVFRNHIDKLNQAIGDNGAINWAVDPTDANSTGRILRTTGTAIAAATPEGSTGTRKSLLINDLAAAKARMSNDNVPQKDNFYCLMPSNMYWDFVNANKEVLNNDYMNKGNLPQGIVSYVHGWYIINRGETARYNSGATAKKAYGAAIAADDNGAAICWNSAYVTKALGSTRIYSDLDKPEYQGDIYSSRTRFQNKALRTDLKGLVTIVQSA